MLKKHINLILFTIFFVVIAPIIVLYAKGDIFTNGWNILKTGGIFVTNSPQGSEVFLNLKSRGVTGFFERDVLLKNLRPAVYDISIKKEGYNSWANKIEVVDNIVSDATVFMLPTKIELREITKLNTVPSSSSTTVGTKIKNKEYSDILLAFTSKTPVSQKNSSTTTIDFKSNLGTRNAPIMDSKLALWQENGKVFTKWFGRNDTAPKYLCVDFDCTKEVSVYYFNTSIKQLGFLPGFDGVAVFAVQNKIIAMQIDPKLQKVSQNIFTGKNPDFRIVNGAMFVKDGEYLAEVVL